MREQSHNKAADKGHNSEQERTSNRGDTCREKVVKPLHCINNEPKPASSTRVGGVFREWTPSLNKAGSSRGLRWPNFNFLSPIDGMLWRHYSDNDNNNCFNIISGDIDGGAAATIAVNQSTEPSR